MSPLRVELSTPGYYLWERDDKWEVLEGRLPIGHIPKAHALPLARVVELSDDYARQNAVELRSYMTGVQV